MFTLGIERNIGLLKLLGISKQTENTRQLDAVFFALKLQQVSNMFEIPAKNRTWFARAI